MGTSRESTGLRLGVRCYYVNITNGIHENHRGIVR